ncbi:MAG: hypothetical protein C4538_08765 [Nitrospiraceae bacterium]|nr:MAG: hypothetical protein C4538_08765 [Nitrospiraceae bacterium]
MTSTDSIKDRLAAYYHWNYIQALEQAIMVANEQKSDIGEVRRWSLKEGHKDKFQHFLDELKTSQKNTSQK